LPTAPDGTLDRVTGREPDGSRGQVAGSRFRALLTLCEQHRFWVRARDGRELLTKCDQRPSLTVDIFAGQRVCRPDRCSSETCAHRIRRTGRLATTNLYRPGMRSDLSTTRITQGAPAGGDATRGRPRSRRGSLAVSHRRPCDLLVVHLSRPSCGVTNGHRPTREVVK